MDWRIDVGQATGLFRKQPTPGDFGCLSLRLAPTAGWLSNSDKALRPPTAPGGSSNATVSLNGVSFDALRFKEAGSFDLRGVCAGASGVVLNAAFGPPIEMTKVESGVIAGGKYCVSVTSAELKLEGPLLLGVLAAVFVNELGLLANDGGGGGG